MIKKGDPQESAPEFLAALRNLASKCRIQSLDETLLDQFIQGQLDKKLKQKLAMNEDITFKMTTTRYPEKGAGQETRPPQGCLRSTSCDEKTPQTPTRTAYTRCSVMDTDPPPR